MDFSTFKPITPDEFKQKHSKTLYRSICVPSTVQAYSLCIEYMKSWFIGKFSPDTFKSIYIEGKNIYDDFRSLSKLELLKRQKPSLAITPNISWDFNNEQIDSYPYGMDLYVQTGKFKNSFFSLVIFSKTFTILEISKPTPNINIIVTIIKTTKTNFIDYVSPLQSIQSPRPRGTKFAMLFAQE